MEFVTIKLPQSKWEEIVKTLSPFNYEVKSVEVVDDFFKNDETHHKLKDASIKAYKQLKEYEFKTRHSIK